VLIAGLDARRPRGFLGGSRRSRVQRRFGAGGSGLQRFGGRGGHMNLTEFISKLQNASCVPDDFALPDATNTCIEEAQNSTAQTTGNFIQRMQAKIQAKIQKSICITTSLGVITADGSAVNDPITLPSTLTSNATWITEQEQVLADCRTNVTSILTSLPNFATMLENPPTLSEVQGKLILKCWMKSLKCLSQASTASTPAHPERTGLAPTRAHPERTQS